MSRKGFTLIELLVVIAIIALLVSILMPSLSRAKLLAQRVNCVTRVAGIGQACFLYAGDSNSYNPWRDPEHAVMPHCAYQSWGEWTFDLNKTFFEPYLGSREAAFCPSRLMDSRNPDTYPYEYVTYQYNNIGDGSAAGTWLWDEKPNLTRIDTPDKRYALWGCMTLHINSSGLWFGHERPIVCSAPEGQSNVFTDGSAEFVNYDDLAIFWSLPGYNQEWYWATPG